MKSESNTIPKFVYTASHHHAQQQFSAPDADLPALLTRLLGVGDRAPRQGMRAVVKFLIRQGREYARTPAGEQWRQLLAASPAVHKGWILWHQSNAEFYVRHAEDLEDDPLRMFEDIMQHLQTTEMESLLGALSDAAMVSDVAASAAQEEN